VNYKKLITLTALCFVAALLVTFNNGYINLALTCFSVIIAVMINKSTILFLSKKIRPNSAQL